MSTEIIDGELVRARLSDRVRAHARRSSLGATVLDILLAPLYALGWVVFWVLLLITETSRLGFAAVQLGWLDARARAASRQIAVDRWPVRPRSPKPRARGGAG